MKITIDIPDEFINDYTADRFKDFFSRVAADIDNDGLCGNYEKETAEMFLKAFEESGRETNTDKEPKMERLTKLGAISGKDINELLNESNENQMGKTKAYYKLQEYEDLEEQGLLLRLPCKIGSEVWEIERQFWIDRKGCKDCIYFGNDGLGDYCDYDEDSPSACTKIVPKKFNIRMLDNFDKTVFLTKSEAEAKLKELRGEENESSN